MNIRIILLIFFAPLKLYSQVLECKDVKEPAGWIRKSTRLSVDFHDVYGDGDSSSISGDKDNLPIPSNQIISDTSKNYYLKLIQGNLKSFKNNECVVTLLIVNNTDSLVEVATLDGTLLAVPEIYYNEKWYPIEYFMTPECGNSYWDIPLKSGKCYTVLYEKYLGTSSSKLRYKMKLKGKYIVSNSIDSKFNIEQLILDNNQIEYPIINFAD